MVDTPVAGIQVLFIERANFESIQGLMGILIYPGAAAIKTLTGMNAIEAKVQWLKEQCPMLSSSSKPQQTASAYSFNTPPFKIIVLTYLPGHVILASTGSVCLVMT